MTKLSTLGFIKNGEKYKVLAQMPATYPASRVMMENGDSVEDALDAKMGYKNLGTIGASSSKVVTIPYGSRGFIFLCGGSSNVFGVIQYMGASSYIVQKTVGSLGADISVSLSGQLLTISNNNTGNGCYVDCMLLSGNAPTMS